MTKAKYLLINLFFLFPLLAQAQEGSIATIEYMDGMPGDVIVTHVTGEEEEAYIGMVIPLESSISTASATVELRLDPNGTIFKLDENTLFILNSIQGRRGDDETSLSLIRGRLRTIAARNGLNNNYTVRTPTAVCGIRGTEILNIVTSDENAIICKSGAVEVINTRNTADKVLIEANQMINTRTDSFQPVLMTEEQINQIFSQLDFVNLDPMDVPGHLEEIGQEMVSEPETEEPPLDEEEPVDQPEATEDPIIEEPQEEVVEEEPTVDEEPVAESISAAPITAVTTDEEPEIDSQEEGEHESDEPSAFEEWFRNFMAFELGAVTIDGETWSKVILQPDLATDKLALGLYLPIIYKENFLDPQDWYTPEGNNEWSFGSDQSDIEDILLDFSKDLFLKIKYLEYGDQLWDPFYVKIGNLETMTLGHGSLIQNYSNNTNFPTERMVGVNLGANIQGNRIETLVDDATDPSLAGLRFQLGTGGITMGIGSVVDFYPLNSYEDYIVEMMGNPYLAGFSLDMEFLKLDTDLFKLLAYVDASTIMPLFREESVLYPELEWDNHIEYLYSDSLVKNYGMKAGVLGEVAIVDYNLDLRYENGVYRHNFFDNLYTRNKLERVDTILSERITPSEETIHHLNIYGEAGFNLLSRKLRVMAAYLWPLEYDGTEVSISSEDYVKAGLELQPGLIPIYDIYGALYYERTGLATTIDDEEFDLLNTQTIISGEVVMPLAPTLDLALMASTATAYDSDGNIIMEDGEPKIVPVISIETRVHF